MSVKYSSTGSRLDSKRSGAVPRPNSRKASAVVETSDTLALKAWVERGMPEQEIVYDEDVPKLTPEQLEEFRLSGFKIFKP